MLDRKVAIITGGGSGIGRSAGLVFARYGARVILCDIDQEGGNETARLITDAGGEACFVPANVTVDADVQAMVQAALDSYGRLDCAFNNAGVEGELAPTAGQTEANWDRVINVNLRGVWLCMRREIPAMLASGGGAIVNTASVGGLVGSLNNSPYAAAKHGVLGLTKSAAIEYARQNIRINAVCPGVTHTPMVDRSASPERVALYMEAQPIGRMGQPEELAEAAAWLCSDRASFITGHPLVVDGGLFAQ